MAKRRTSIDYLNSWRDISEIQGAGVRLKWEAEVVFINYSYRKVFDYEKNDEEQIDIPLPEGVL